MKKTNMKKQIRIANSHWFLKLYLYFGLKNGHFLIDFCKKVKHKNLLNIRSTQILMKVSYVVFINANLCECFILTVDLESVLQ